MKISHEINSFNLCQKRKYSFKKHKAYELKVCCTVFIFLHGDLLQTILNFRIESARRYKNYWIKTSFFLRKTLLKFSSKQNSLVDILTKYISLEK